MADAPELVACNGVLWDDQETIPAFYRHVDEFERSDRQVDPRLAFVTRLLIQSSVESALAAPVHFVHDGRLEYGRDR